MSIALWTANALAKHGEAAELNYGDGVVAASDRAAVTSPDEQLSTAEMELRIKFLQENR